MTTEYTNSATFSHEIVAIEEAKIGIFFSALSIQLLLTPKMLRMKNIMPLYLEKNANPESTFVIVDLKDDVMVGTVSLEKIDRTDSKATLGIFIGRSEYRSKGYGAEAINLILDLVLKQNSLYLLIKINGQLLLNLITNIIKVKKI